MDNYQEGAPQGDLLDWRGPCGEPEALFFVAPEAPCRWMPVMRWSIRANRGNPGGEIAAKST